MLEYPLWGKKKNYRKYTDGNDLTWSKLHSLISDLE